MTELLSQGAAMSLAGPRLVLGALAIVWGFIAGLTRLFPASSEVETAGRAAGAQPALEGGIVRIFEAAHSEPQATLTEERARVAAIVAGVLLAKAITEPAEISVEPALERSRPSPAWVSVKRAQALQPWQPPRNRGEG